MMYHDGSRNTHTYDGVEYAPGKKFRVVREGAHLSGMKPTHPSAWEGTRRVLHVGDIIECNGVGFGFGSDPGYGVEWVDPDLGFHVDFWPSRGGIFSYHPADGFLEPVEEKEGGTAA